MMASLLPYRTVLLSSAVGVLGVAAIVVTLNGAWTDLASAGELLALTAATVGSMTAVALGAWSVTSEIRWSTLDSTLTLGGRTGWGARKATCAVAAVGALVAVPAIVLTISVAAGLSPVAAVTSIGALVAASGYWAWLGAAAGALGRRTLPVLAAVLSYMFAEQPLGLAMGLSPTVLSALPFGAGTGLLHGLSYSGAAATMQPAALTYLVPGVCTAAAFLYTVLATVAVVLIRPQRRTGD